MKTKRIWLTLLVVALAALACTLPGGQPLPDVDEVGTQVAATLTALAAVDDATPEPPAGGTETPTASPTASPTEPPPVLRIVYTNAGDAWLLEEGGTPQQLTFLGDVDTVLISSDGEKVAYVRSPTPGSAPVEIRSVNSDGTGDQVLMTPADFDSLYPLGNFLHNDLFRLDFIPGTHVLMMNTRGVPEGPGLANYDDLLTLDADTGARTTIFPPGEGGDFFISPDGSQVAITTATTISVANIDGTNLRSDVVTYESIITYSEFLYAVPVVWSPDSTQMGVVIPSADILAPDRSGQVWRIPADGGAPINLATIEGDFYFTQFGNRNTAISPNLERVAFLRESTTPGLEMLFTANSNGSGEASVVFGIIGWHGWSPDSMHFVFSEDSPPILSVGVVGGAPTLVGPGSDVRWLNETEFLYLTGSLGAWSLTLGTVGGGSTTLVSPAGEFISYDFAN